MATNMAGIEPGMDVLDVSGEKVGTVADVLTIQAFSQAGASSAYASPTTDPGTGGYGTGPVTSGVVSAGEGSILQVEQGGILGIGARDLYIPFGDVQNVVPGSNVTVNCTKDMCAERYGNKPDFLGNV